MSSAALESPGQGGVAATQIDANSQASSRGLWRTEALMLRFSRSSESERRERPDWARFTRVLHGTVRRHTQANSDAPPYMYTKWCQGS